MAERYNDAPLAVWDEAVVCMDNVAVRGVSAEPLLGPVDFSQWLQKSCQVCQDCGCGISLDNQKRHHGSQQSNDISSPVDFPSGRRFPSMGTDTLMVPSDLSADSKKPIHDGGIGVVDRESCAVGSSSAPTPVQISLAIEEAGKISDSSIVFGDFDCHGGEARAGPSKGSSGSNEPSTERRSANSVSTGNLGDSVPASVRSDDRCVCHCHALRLPHCTTGLAWIIIGGESGPANAPVTSPGFVLSSSSASANVPVFVKQDSGPLSEMQGRISSDLWAYKEFPR